VADNSQLSGTKLYLILVRSGEMSTSGAWRMTTKNSVLLTLVEPVRSILHRACGADLQRNAWRCVAGIVQ
jgi:hypothetical protein